MNFLVHTILGDIHADAVAWAMEQRGHTVQLLVAENFPISTLSSISHSSQGNAHLSWAGQQIHRADAVWNRRFGVPTISEDVHSADQRYVSLECAEYLKSFNYLAGHRAFEINPLAGQRVARLKPVQLSFATRVGLRVPDTLVSNDPAEIRRFFDFCQEQMVFKCSVPHCWRGDDGVAHNVTSRVLRSDLDDDEVIRTAPGIYQRLLPKFREFRITVMGRCAFIAITCPSDKTAIDTRMHRQDFVDGTSAFPQHIIEKCFSLMDEMGIYFGCFDFFQTSPGTDPIFLEINEMGQWLAIEHRLHHFNMIERFCELVESRDPFHCSPPRNNATRYFDLYQKTERYHECCKQLRGLIDRVEKWGQLTYE